jgi:hypothetical protein
VHMLLKHAGQWKNEEASSAMALKSIIKQQKKESKNMIQQLNIPISYLHKNNKPHNKALNTKRKQKRANG